MSWCLFCLSPKRNKTTNQIVNKQHHSGFKRFVCLSEMKAAALLEGALYLIVYLLCLGNDITIATNKVNVTCASYGLLWNK